MGLFSSIYIKKQHRQEVDALKTIRIKVLQRVTRMDKEKCTPFSQMTEVEAKKTKEVANLRIHVEPAINRIKTYRILKTVMPITMLHHCDDIY